jgi:hypothetical protein
MKLNEIIEQLKHLPIAEISRFTDCTKTKLDSLKRVEVYTLYDLWNKNFDNINVKGFHRNSAKRLQEEFKSFTPEQFEDILFWNRQQNLPSNYDADKTIEENLQMVLVELIDYLNNCLKRCSQIPKKTDKERIKTLDVILNGFYFENLDKVDVAKIINLKEERVRQLVFVELLYPLFSGRSLSNKILNSISIKKKLLQRIKEFRKTRMFTKYHMADNCSQRFFEDIVRVDFLNYNPFSYIVPNQEKLCYKHVLQAFFDEMTAVMEATQAEELAEIIDQNEIIQKEIKEKNKSYDEDFIYQLLYDEKIILDTESGKIIRPELIRHKGTNELGEVYQERAVARIIADQKDNISKKEVIEIYKQRYNVQLPDSISFAPCKKYGCKIYGKSFWTYNKTNVINLKDWISQYTAEVGKPFTMKNILDAIADADIPYNSDATIRTYITNNCAVHCQKSHIFCHRDIIDKQKDPKVWRRKVQSGVINWIANELKLLFHARQADQLERKEIINYLRERAQYSDYYGLTENNINNNCYSWFSEKDEDKAPFQIVTSNEKRGTWELKINEKVYNDNEFDWLTYGLEGRHYQRKLIYEAVHAVRQTKANQMLLTDLVECIGNVIDNDSYDSNNCEPLSKEQIRRKLLKFINERDEINHPLYLRQNEQRQYIVTIDARRINETARYQPHNKQTEIKYQLSSEMNEVDWGVLRILLLNELSFCQEWMEKDGLNINFNTILDEFIDFIQTDFNKNLNTMVPLNIYKFFVMSDPTEYDRYSIMCNIAKNFEGLIDSIFKRKTRRYNNIMESANCKGLFNKTQSYQFSDYTKILNNQTSIDEFESDSYQYVLKTLNLVRNTDSHGLWYNDRYAKNNLTENDRNVKKISQFFALYIFTYAKYAK